LFKRNRNRCKPQETARSAVGLAHYWRIGSRNTRAESRRAISVWSADENECMRGSNASPPREGSGGSTWERLVAPATVLGVLAAVVGLGFAGYQLKTVSEQTGLAADATELQAFTALRKEVYDARKIRRFNRAAEYLRAVIRRPRDRFSLPASEGTAIVFQVGKYEQLAQLFLADRSALPHARELFGEPMACALLDYKLLLTKSKNFTLPSPRSLPTFLGDVKCKSKIDVHGVSVGYVAGG
jgi:hypothetical protein